jgi:hypothetical protein
VDFLVDVLGLLRQSARVLLLHGFGASWQWQSWWNYDKRLIAAFLDLDSDADIKVDWHYAAGRNSLGRLSHGVRKVIYSRALSNRVTPVYVEAVRSEVQSDGVPT